MFSLLLNAAKYVWGEQEPEDDINKVLARIEDAAQNAAPSEVQENKVVSEVGCFYRTGIVTVVTNDYVLIDDLHICEKVNINVAELKISDKINYLAFQVDETQPLKVRKIISIVDSAWEDDVEIPVNENVVTQSGQILRKMLVGKVIKRNGRTVYVQPNDLIVDLDKIHSVFIPMVGDWVKLEAVVEVDDSRTDLTGEVLEMETIIPLRSNLVVGNVTSYDSAKGFGLIDKSIVFIKNVCKPGYVPCVGDKVASDSIESEQGMYTWRSLSVVPLTQMQSKNNSNQRKVEIPQSELARLLKDKEGIEITNDLSYNIGINQDIQATVLVTNTSEKEQKILKCCFMSKKSNSQIALLSPKLDDSVTIEPNGSVTYKFKCTAKFVGTSEEIFIFSFEGFKIARIFRITVAGIQTTTPKNKPPENIFYGRHLNEKVARQDVYEDGTYIQGVRPFRPANFIVNRPGIFKIPQKFWNVMLKVLNERTTQAASIAMVQNEIPSLMEQLCFRTYKDHFHALLYLEEITAITEMHKFDMNSACMKNIGEYLSLEVPGLMEKRPSLIIGDKAVVTFKWASSNGRHLNYEGYIHKIKNSEVYLKFNERFHSEYHGEDIKVTFKSSTSVIRRCHNAINLAINHLGGDFLFPTKVVPKESQYNFTEIEEGSSLNNIFTNGDKIETNWSDNRSKEFEKALKERKLTWINKKLNYYQKEAVKNILKGHARPLPYVIFGPPGTGKTITMCESVLQILLTISESRILIATPSNSSANLIAERLLDSQVLSPGDLVRLVAYHYIEEGNIPEKLLPYCATADIAAEGTRGNVNLTDDKGTKLQCTMSVLGRHRITIGTCTALSVLYTMGFPRGHFSHLLIDEAGQATEPELLIPLSLIHADSGQVVLAGDPMQLGPVVQSRFAEHFGLGESFLSRLLQQFPYQKDPEGFSTGYDPRLVTKLLMNYRSLPEMLELPNSLFYDSELLPQVCEEESEEAILLEILSPELPKRLGRTPAIVFHGVQGINQQDEDSPSWYNPEEATQVYFYLLKFYELGLEADDVGIITPYQKQVRRIKDLLTELDTPLPKIATVEEFQGQERKVILLSTVRSTSNLISEDVKHALGFVAAPSRLNVAITRARSLLLIIGNPYLLQQDPYWRSVLEYCCERKAYTGCTFTQTKAEEDLTITDREMELKKFIN